MIRGPQFIRKKAFEGRNLPEKPSKQTKFDQISYVCLFLRCSRAACLRPLSNSNKKCISVMLGSMWVKLMRPFITLKNVRFLQNYFAISKLLFLLVLVKTFLNFFCHNHKIVMSAKINCFCLNQQSCRPPSFLADATTATKKIVK
jgi:hypothetical protein